MYALKTRASIPGVEKRAGAKPAWSATLGVQLTGKVLLVAAGCCLGAWVGVHFGLSPLRISSVNAILLGVLLLVPAGRWWLYLLAGLPAHFYLAAHFQAVGMPLVAMFCQFCAGVFQVVLAALLARRVVGLPPRLDTLRRMVGFILLASIAAPAIISALTASSFVLTGWMDDFWLAWRIRFLSNVFITLTLTPLILLTVTSETGAWRRMPLLRHVEAGLFVAGTFAVGIAVFGIEDSNLRTYPLLLYAPLPLFLWAAVRFELGMLSASLLIIALVSVTHTSVGRGPFATGPSGETLKQFQLYLLAISLPFTLLATVLQERRRAVAALEQSEREARGQLAQLSAIYGAAPTGLAFIDTELRYVSINDYLAELNHLPAAAHIGRTLREVLGNDTANQIEPLYREVIKTGEPIVNREIRIPSTGSRAPEVRMVSYHPVKNARGDVMGVSAVIQEITARKRAEETLRNIAAGVSAKTGDTFFQSLAEHISNALQVEYTYVCEVKEGGRSARTIASYVNGTAAENVDYDLAGTPCEQVLRLGVAVYPQGIQESFPEDGMLREIGAEGYLGVCLKDSTGKALGLMGVLSRKGLVNVEATLSMLNIFATRASAELERKKDEDRLRVREQELRVSEERYREVVESQTDLVCRYKPDGTLTFVNGAYCRFFGCPREKIIGRKFFAFIPEENRAAAIEHVAMLNKERRPLTVEHEVTLPDGNIAWQHWADYPVVGPDGEVTEFQGIGRDITDRKRAEQASARLAAIVRYSGDAIISKDLNGIITSWNEGAERLFGYTADEVIGRPVVILVPPDRLDEEARTLEPLRRGERVDRFETVRMHKDGSLLDISLTVSPLKDSAGRVVGASKIARDITDRKRAEEANLKLAHASRLVMVGELTAMVVHELSQPLSAMQCNARAGELMLENPNPPPLEVLRQILEEIQRDNRRASQSVHRMRTLLRVRKLELTSLDLTELVAEVLQIASREAARRRVQIRIEGDSDCSPVKGDRVHLQQVLLNLILNGMDAMANTPEARRTLLIRMGENGNGVEVAISDAGQGIPVDRLPQIFDSFFTTKQEGLGLGLSISKWIVEAHRGRIRAENNPNGGATFHFTLPNNNVHAPQTTLTMPPLQFSD